MGRIAELLGAECLLTGNTFTGNLGAAVPAVPVWKDAAAVTLEDRANTVEGF